MLLWTIAKASRTLLLLIKKFVDKALALHSYTVHLAIYTLHLLEFCFRCMDIYSDIIVRRLFGGSYNRLLHCTNFRNVPPIYIIKIHTKKLLYFQQCSFLSTSTCTCVNINVVVTSLTVTLLVKGFLYSYVTTQFTTQSCMVAGFKASNQKHTCISIALCIK